MFQWCSILLVFFNSISGVFLISEDTPFTKDDIIELLRLKVGTEQFDRWESTPFDLNFNVYIFDVQNVDEIMNGTTPLVREVGPYIYKKFKEKHNIKYNEEDDTLEYEESIRFEFDVEASFPLTENDIVTVLNVQQQNLFQVVEDVSSQTVSAAWNRIFQDTTTLFHQIPVKDLLFEGYRFCDPNIMQGVTYVIARLICSNIRSGLLESIFIEGDNTVVFSFFKHKIRNEHGPLTIKAGNLNIADIGSIQTFKGLNYTTSGIDEGNCNKLQGTDGLLYPPFNNYQSNFEVYNFDICRVSTFRTNANSSYQDIKSYIATLDSNIFSNLNDQECYCINATRNLNGKYSCFPFGFGDMFTCMGYHIITSFPHFLHGNVEFDIEGLTPNEDFHESSIMIEPVTGWILQGTTRLQYNMVIRPINDIVITENIKPTLMPILWVEESVRLPDNLVQKLKDDILSKLEVEETTTEEIDTDEDEDENEDDNDPGGTTSLKPHFIWTYIYCILLYKLFCLM